MFTSNANSKDVDQSVRIICGVRLLRKDNVIHLTTFAEVFYDISFKFSMSSLSSPQGRDDNMKLSGHILKSDQSVERMFIL